MATPVALIGAGKHGERYLRHVLEDVPELRVSIVCRRDPERGREQASRAGGRWVVDFREAVTAPDVAAVIAVVPPSLHREIAELAAAAGKALLLEKPVATTVTAALHMRDALDRADVPCMIAHTLRYNQVVRAIQRELPGLGPIRQMSLSQRFEPSPIAWLDEPEASGGGIILHTGVHSFDLMRVFSGRNPESVSAFAARVETRNTEDNFVATVRFEGGDLIATVSGSRSTRSRNGSIEIAGERGQLLGDHHHGVLERARGSTRIPVETGPIVPTVRETLRAFARTVTKGEPPEIPFDAGLWSLATAEACYRSLETGKAETVARLFNGL